MGLSFFFLPSQVKHETFVDKKNEYATFKLKKQQLNFDTRV